MVEGVAHPRGDPFRDAVGIAQHVHGRNTQDFEPSLTQKFVSHRVSLRPVAVSMRFAIHLHNEVPFNTTKIGYIRTNRMLAPEFRAQPASTDPLPKHHFRQTHFPTQFAGMVNLWPLLERGTPSTTPFRRGPPPRPGEDHASYPMCAIHAPQAPFARSRTRPM